MDLKEKLELLRLNNKFKDFDGIKVLKIYSMDELTKREKNVLDSIDTDCNVYTDKMLLSANYADYILWSKEKIEPYIQNSEVIIMDSYKLIFIMVENAEIFLESYFKKTESFCIYILNRKLMKWIVISKGEYFLEYFNKNI